MKIISINLTTTFKENFRGTTILPYHLLKGKSKAYAYYADCADDLISQNLVPTEDPDGVDGLIRGPTHPPL